MAQRYAWFRPMLEQIAKRRMASATFGLKLRLALGAGFSTANMCSDINSIVVMLQTGHVVGAYAMIGLISMSVAAQLWLSFFQNKHLGRKAVAWEALLVLSLAKPGVDAIRVALDAEQSAGAPVDPFTELIFGKVVEIAFEAGPGAAVQAAIVLGGGWSTAAVASVGISCLSTGFTTAMMAFDFDTKPAHRKGVPEMYGYIPDRAHKRVLIFLELFALHSVHSMLKTLTLGLLARTNWHWLVSYLAADHCAYILYKVARRDLIYYVPGPALSRFVLHFLSR
jgi:hypothetical protein